MEGLLRVEGRSAGPRRATDRGPTEEMVKAVKVLG
jgi:hypothetical protein